MFTKVHFLICLSLFILLNTCLFFFIIAFNSKLPFHSIHYFYFANHYIDDPRAYVGKFNLIQALGAWDAQWYLRIADAGYPSKDFFEPHYYFTSGMGRLTYAFWPMYPLLLFCLNLIVHNIILTAYIAMNMLLYGIFFSMYYVVSKLYSQAIAGRSVYLMFLFPFSIFYRSYYAEGLFVLLLIWFVYFTCKKQWFFAALMGAVLAITRPYGVVFLFILFVNMLAAAWRKTFRWKRMFLSVLLSIVPLCVWCYYCYVQTGNPYYWRVAESVWYTPKSFYDPLLHNLNQIRSLWSLPFHDFRESKIDTAMVVVAAVLLFLSRKFLRPQLWWISFILWFVPLVTKDLMSYTRFEIVSFPLFIYLGAQVRGVSFYLLSSLFLVLLFVVSLYFVNWYWLA